MNVQALLLSIKASTEAILVLVNGMLEEHTQVTAEAQERARQAQSAKPTSCAHPAERRIPAGAMGNPDAWLCSDCQHYEGRPTA